MAQQQTQQQKLHRKRDVDADKETMKQQKFDEHRLWTKVVKKDERILSCYSSGNQWEQIIMCGHLPLMIRTSDKNKTVSRMSRLLHSLESLYLEKTFLPFSVIPSREELLEKRVNLLEAKVRQLEVERGAKAKEIMPTKADQIYEKERLTLESKFLGKIVAIDLVAKKVVGVGDTMIDAYEDALKNSAERQFSFRKVGSKYISRV